MAYESAAAEEPTPYINGRPVNLATNPIGTPITVVGNLNDTVIIQTASMIGPNGQSVPMNITNSVYSVPATDPTADPNRNLAPFSAFAFPSNPLQPNTTYSVSLNGAINGTPFSRNFSFTTGNQGQF